MQKNIHFFVQMSRNLRCTLGDLSEHTEMSVYVLVRQFTSVYSTNTETTEAEIFVCRSANEPRIHNKVDIILA